MRTTLRPGEVVVLVARRHWLMLAVPVLLVVLLLAAAVAALAAGFGQFALYFLALAVIPALYLAYRAYDRKLNILVVTNLRVIEEWGVLTHNAKESLLDKVNNVSYTQSLLGLFFNYGEVEIQTAAEMGATRLAMVMDPKALKETIAQCQADAGRRLFAEQAAAVTRAMQEPAAEGATKECPFCAETIKAKAVVCRYCGREVPV